MNKIEQIENKFYELISERKNISTLWDSAGPNFIVWSIAPMKKKNWNQDFILWCELLGQEIAKQVDFYCCPAILTFKGFVKLTFNF